MDACSVESNNTRSMFSRKKIKVHISVQREAIKYERVFVRKQILPLEQKQQSYIGRKSQFTGDREKQRKILHTIAVNVGNIETADLHRMK